MNNLLLVLFFFILISCAKEKEKVEVLEKDATTAASIDTDKWIPPQSETYQVLGYKEGIKGVVIRYSDSLYRGGDILSSKGAMYLKSLGIQTVISVTPSDQIRSLCKTFGFVNIELPFDYQKLTKTELNTFKEIIKEEETPLYIHCYSGKQRGGNLIVLYRDIVNNWKFEEAMIEYDQCGGKLHEDRNMLKELYR